MSIIEFHNTFLFTLFERIFVLLVLIILFSFYVIHFIFMKGLKTNTLLIRKLKYLLK